ncbi:hypothetical protein VD659_04560 [Herbiconiux sp. 11R-BC]|uniref:hypothetical protein n=1 Tax=Herbiconiux sp. 11R-BC TaxID=3111637 RepID=UPI003BFF6389
MDHNRLTRQFLGSLIVAVLGCLGALASLVFNYTATTDGLRITLDITLAVSLAVIVAAAAFCIVVAARIRKLPRQRR